MFCGYYDYVIYLTANQYYQIIISVFFFFSIASNYSNINPFNTMDFHIPPPFSPNINALVTLIKKHRNWHVREGVLKRLTYPSMFFRLRIFSGLSRTHENLTRRLREGIIQCSNCRARRNYWRSSRSFSAINLVDVKATSWRTGFSRTETLEPLSLCHWPLKWYVVLAGTYIHTDTYVVNVRKQDMARRGTRTINTLNQILIRLIRILQRSHLVIFYEIIIVGEL